MDMYSTSLHQTTTAVTAVDTAAASVGRHKGGMVTVVKCFISSDISGTKGKQQ